MWCATFVGVRVHPSTLTSGNHPLSALILALDVTLPELDLLHSPEIMCHNGFEVKPGLLLKLSWLLQSPMSLKEWTLIHQTNFLEPKHILKFLYLLYNLKYLTDSEEGAFQFSQ